MERDGLLHVLGDRQLSLSEIGRTLATRVMRKHRLAECLLVGVIKLPWEEVHIEACRWEHVISESVERRLVELLDYPIRCPHGNVIPGLAELGVPGEADEEMRTAMTEAGEAMTKVVSADGVQVVIRRIGEQIQSDLVLMHKLSRAGIQPGREVILMAAGDGVRVTASPSAAGPSAAGNSATGGSAAAGSAAGNSAAGGSPDSGSAELAGTVAAHIFVSRSSGYPRPASGSAAGA
jgi:DtxR family Mn-dependent transcriptional regulator